MNTNTKDFELFLDSADPLVIKKTIGSFPISGITTNPTLAAKVLGGRSSTVIPLAERFSAYIEILREISQSVSGPISAEVVATEFEDMLVEAEQLLGVAKQIVIKLPVTKNGFKACKHLADKGVRVNMTLCFTPTQAFLAAFMGASYISPFIGRLDDIGLDGLELIRDIKQIYANYNFDTKILAASIRNVGHLLGVLKIGVGAVTVPGSLIESAFNHPMTDTGLELFLNDWRK